MESKPLVLYVGDEDSFADRLIFLFATHEVDMRFSSGEVAARDVLDLEAPLFDLLIVDADGDHAPINLQAARFARWIRPHLPMIALTNGASIEGQIEGLMVVEIIKPCEPEALVRAADSMLGEFR